MSQEKPLEKTLKGGSTGYERFPRQLLYKKTPLTPLNLPRWYFKVVFSGPSLTVHSVHVLDNYIALGKKCCSTLKRMKFRAVLHCLLNLFHPACFHDMLMFLAQVEKLQFYALRWVFSKGIEEGIMSDDILINDFSIDSCDM